MHDGGRDVREGGRVVRGLWPLSVLKVELGVAAGEEKPIGADKPTGRCGSGFCGLDFFFASATACCARDRIRCTLRSEVLGSKQTATTTIDNSSTNKSRGLIVGGMRPVPSQTREIDCLRKCQVKSSQVKSTCSIRRAFSSEVFTYCN
jgi:hypothetical protein